MKFLGKIFNLAVLLILAYGIAQLFQADIPTYKVDAKYSNSASQFLRLADGTGAHVRDQGRRDAPILLLLHGSAASLHTWEGWVREMEESWRIITIDLPGHGLTGRTPDENYTIEGAIHFLDRVVERMRLKRFVIGGNSMGGHVAWRYALARTDKVEALILVAASGYPREGGGRFFGRLLQYPPIRWLLEYIWLRPLMERALRQAYNDSPLLTDAVMDRYADLNLRAGTRHATFLRFEENARRRASPPPKNVLGIPTLILWGEEDRLIPVAHAEKFSQDIPQSMTVLYPSLGHVPMEESPKETARAVVAFLSPLYKKEEDKKAQPQKALPQNTQPREAQPQNTPPQNLQGINPQESVK